MDPSRKGSRNRISPWWWLTIPINFSSIWTLNMLPMLIECNIHHTPYMQWKWYHFESEKNGCFSFHDLNELISDFDEMRIWLSLKPPAKTIPKSNIFFPTRSSKSALGSSLSIVNSQWREKMKYYLFNKWNRIISSFLTQEYFDAMEHQEQETFDEKRKTFSIDWKLKNSVA